MPTCIALLRAVNLGSHNKVSMADLRAFVEKLGGEDVNTVVQSGNLVFRTAVTSPAKLEAQLEAAAVKQLGLTTDFFVRTAKEWAAIVAANPFPKMAKDDPSHLVMMTLREAPTAKAVDDLRAAIKGREQVDANGREAYFTYPDGIGTSKLTIAIIEKNLGTRGTARNWNTVLKLGGLAGLRGPT
jgi:uncharacterized protein (DUF1697 family)